jgi:hypothetical protein
MIQHHFSIIKKGGKCCLSFVPEDVFSYLGTNPKFRQPHKLSFLATETPENKLERLSFASFFSPVFY